MGVKKKKRKNQTLKSDSQDAPLFTEQKMRV